jgi:lysyl-tRNA synthetase class 1
MSDPTAGTPPPLTALDQPDQHSVDPDALSAQVPGRRLGDGQPGSARRRGRQRRGARRLARHGQHVDNGPAAGGGQVRHREAGAPNRAENLQVQILLPVLVGDLIDPPGGALARVVHQAVDAAPPIDRRPDKPFEIGQAGDVGPHRNGLAPGLAKTLFSGGQPAGVPSAHRHFGPFFYEPARQRRAQPVGPACDQDDFAVEMQIHTVIVPQPAWCLRSYLSGHHRKIKELLTAKNRRRGTLAVVHRKAESDWVSRFADAVTAEAERRNPGQPIVVASGLSPSGPIHLGNLREVMTPHLVADELRRRGLACTHILSWDDYDRFRKVPAGIDPRWDRHIGKPLTSVPAPAGSGHPNWAEHFRAPMEAALARLGVAYEGISQTERYTSGAYRDQVLLATAGRHRIDAVLARFRTKAGPVPPGSDPADDDGTAAVGYFPYKPYCSACERDLTTVTAYDEATTSFSYTCACGHSETALLSDHRRGKLVWKVDWPMRWAYEGVVFEPSGVDHQSPGSSFAIGGQLVEEIFGGQRPIGPMYAFVGISGMAKMSSSRGGVPTPGDALEVMEEPVLRWLYARRKPEQSFTVAFDQEIHRLYDEWDALAHRVAESTATEADATAYDRAVRTAAGPLPRTSRPFPFRTLASVADITTGDAEQMLRILGNLDPGHPLESLAQARPRLDRARTWVDTQLPAQGDAEREALDLLLDGMDEHWSPEGLSRFVYAVPKLQAGLSPDAPPTPELKVAQRAFFALVYQLLIGRETGPRLPTLLLAADADRVRKLLGR